jgi:hypothetical protein
MYTKSQLAQKGSAFSTARKSDAQKIIARKNARSFFSEDDYQLICSIADKGYAIVSGKMKSVMFGVGSKATKNAFIFHI